MRSEIAEKRRALRRPAVRANVLAEVRAGLWTHHQSLRFSRPRMATLDSQLRSPRMVLYGDGVCEIVVPELGPRRIVLLEWEDLTVRLVAAERAWSAGTIIWSHQARAA